MASDSDETPCVKSPRAGHVDSTESSFHFSQHYGYDSVCQVLSLGKAWTTSAAAWWGGSSGATVSSNSRRESRMDSTTLDVHSQPRTLSSPWRVRLPRRPLPDLPCRALVEGVTRTCLTTSRRSERCLDPGPTVSPRGPCRNGQMITRSASSSTVRRAPIGATESKSGYVGRP